MISDLLTAEGRDRLAVRAVDQPVRFLLSVYAASRLVVLAAMVVAGHWFQNPAGVGHLNPNALDLFSVWDATWYGQIAYRGYPVPLPTDADTGRLTYSAWAFYPAFPLLTRRLMLLGLPFQVAGALLNLVLGAIATLLIWQCLRFGLHAEPQPARERLAIVAASLWTLYPATPVMLIPYSEALAACLVAGALLLLMRREYGLVAVTALALGFTRAAAPPLACAVLVHLWLRAREDRQAGVRVLGRQRRSAAAMLLSCLVSAVAWPVAVGWISGLPGAFFDIQASWGQRPDKGPFVLWFSWAWESRGLAGVLVMVGLVAAYLALILGRHGRWIPAEVRIWALAYPLYLLAVVRPITSMWRFLLLDFPVAALLASVAMRTSNGRSLVRHWRRRVALLLVPLIGGLMWWTATLLTFTPWGSTTP